MYGEYESSRAISCRVCTTQASWVFMTQLPCKQDFFSLLFFLEEIWLNSDLNKITFVANCPDKFRNKHCDKGAPCSWASHFVMRTIPTVLFFKAVNVIENLDRSFCLYNIHMNISVTCDRFVLLLPVDGKQSRESRASSTCSCLLSAVFTVGIPCPELIRSRVSLKRPRTDSCLNLPVSLSTGEHKTLLFVYSSTSPECLKHRWHVAAALDKRMKLNADNNRPPYWIMRGS